MKYIFIYIIYYIYWILDMCMVSVCIQDKRGDCIDDDDNLWYKLEGIPIQRRRF